jgi:hypothetical protein
VEFIKATAALTPLARAMAVAMIYPEAGKPKG